MAAPSHQAPLEVHTDFMDLCETTLGLFAARPTWDVLVPALDPRQLEQTIGADLNGDDPVGSWGEADPSQPDDDVYNDEQWNNWYAAPQTPPTDPPPSEMKSDMAPPLTASGGSFAGNKKPLTATEVMEEYVAGLAAKHMPSSGAAQPSSGPAPPSQPSSGWAQPSSGLAQPAQPWAQPSSGWAQPGSAQTSSGSAQTSSGWETSSGSAQPNDDSLWWADGDADQNRQPRPTTWRPNAKKWASRGGNSESQAWRKAKYGKKKQVPVFQGL
jgi:hypothetical protein